MADFTWLTHTLWVYEADRKKEPERRPKKVAPDAGPTVIDRDRESSGKRSEPPSKN